MGRRRRHVVEREPEQGVRRRAVPAERSDHPVLALQRSVGNRAVAEQFELARDKTETAPEETGTGSSTYKLTLEGDRFGDKGMTIVLSSFSSGGGKEKVRNEINVTATLEKSAVDLQRAEIEGWRISKAELVVSREGSPYYTMTMTNALISSFSISGGGGDQPSAVQFQLQFESVEYKYSGGEK